MPVGYEAQSSPSRNRPQTVADTQVFFRFSALCLAKSGMVILQGERLLKY